MAEQESTAKKSTTKKAPAKRSTARKTSTTSAGSKKAPVRKSSARKASAEGSESGRSTSMTSEAPSPKRSTASRVIEEVSRQFTEMSSKQVEGVTGFQRTDDGWLVELDVLELRRVPATTDVIGRYEVSADSSGDVEGYRRLQRYVRGQAEDSS